MTSHPHPLHLFALGALLSLFGGAVAAQKQAPGQPNLDTYRYLVGQYELIGRLPDSTRIFRGTVRLTLDGTRLRMERTINGQTVVGSARIDASGPDRLEVLRATFTIAGTEYQATYLWRSDLDNYPLITGRVFRSGTKSPGIEALFP